MRLLLIIVFLTVSSVSALACKGTEAEGKALLVSKAMNMANYGSKGNPILHDDAKVEGGFISVTTRDSAFYDFTFQDIDGSCFLISVTAEEE